jgi:hypothetical protein
MSYAPKSEQQEREIEIGLIQILPVKINGKKKETKTGILFVRG